jgi:hypothetical protein
LGDQQRDGERLGDPIQGAPASGRHVVNLIVRRIDFAARTE